MVIKEWDQKGVNFSQHLYIPEVHPITNVGFCEMEDEGHVFKGCVCVYWPSSSNQGFHRKIARCG